MSTSQNRLVGGVAPNRPISEGFAAVDFVTAIAHGYKGFSPGGLVACKHLDPPAQIPGEWTGVITFDVRLPCFQPHSSHTLSPYSVRCRHSRYMLLVPEYMEAGKVDIAL